EQPPHLFRDAVGELLVTQVGRQNAPSVRFDFEMLEVGHRGSRVETLRDGVPRGFNRTEAIEINRHMEVDAPLAACVHWILYRGERVGKVFKEAYSLRVADHRLMQVAGFDKLPQLRKGFFAFGRRTVLQLDDD